MNDEELLLAAILSAPEEDTPRLAFADWLQERAGHGDAERAEFIRVQCELALMESMSLGEQIALAARRSELRQREHHLFVLDQFQGWNGFLLDPTDRLLCERMDETPGFRRGFLEDASFGNHGGDIPRVLQLMERHPITSIACRAEDWIAHAEEVLRSGRIRAVTLMTWPEVAAKNDTYDEVPLYRLVGRKKWIRASDIREEDIVIEALLKAEWPGFEFHLSSAPVMQTFYPSI